MLSESPRVPSGPSFWIPGTKEPATQDSEGRRSWTPPSSQLFLAPCRAEGLGRGHCPQAHSGPQPLALLVPISNSSVHRLAPEDSRGPGPCHPTATFTRQEPRQPCAVQVGLSPSSWTPGYALRGSEGPPRSETSVVGWRVDSTSPADTWPRPRLWLSSFHPLLFGHSTVPWSPMGRDSLTKLGASLSSYPHIGFVQARLPLP